MGLGFFARVGAVISTLLLPLSIVHAAGIAYMATALGGNLWRYDYTVTNSKPFIGFDELTVYFDLDEYGLLSTPTGPVDWDPIVAQPDTGIPADGFYDALNVGTPLGDGTSLSGFSVSFVYLGTGSPGAQPFELIDSASLAVLHSGKTAAVPVPEPESLALMLLGLTGIAVARRIRSRSLAATHV